MHLLLLTLMAVPAAEQPKTVGIYRYDGDWVIVSVDRDGNTVDAKVPVTIKRHRLVLNETKGQQPVTVELDLNNRALLWSGGKKPPTEPPPPERIPVTTGQHFWMPGGEMWVIDPLSRMPHPATQFVVRQRYVTLAEPGFYLASKDQLQVFFLALDGNGPSLTLVLKRPGEK